MGYIDTVWVELTFVNMGFLGYWVIFVPLGCGKSGKFVIVGFCFGIFEWGVPRPGCEGTGKYLERDRDYGIV